jgi:hypothetical protein
MSIWTIFFFVGIFVLACGALIGLWLLLEQSHPKDEAKSLKKPPLSNWR